MTDPGGNGTRDVETAAEGRDRPLGIRLFIWLFWFWGGAVALLVLGLVVGDGPVLVNGRALMREEALTAVLPALIPMAFAVVGAALALMLGRSWARAAAMVPFALAAFGPLLTDVGSVSVGELVVAAALLLPVLAGLGWYLYVHPEPRAYFARRSE